MKAIVVKRYKKNGPPHLIDLPEPQMGANDVLVRIEATRWCQTNASSSQFSSGDNLLGRKKIAPLCESGGAVGLEILPTVERALLVEMIMDRGVNCDELLQRSCPTEAKHRPLPSSKRLVRILHTIVGPAASFLTIVDAEVLESRTI